jgi:hypothetical protein
MVFHLKRPLVRRVILALVAAQLLLSAPVASAWSAIAGQQQMDCGDMMPMSGDAESCPCCPEGGAGMSACLSSCLSSLAALAMPSVLPTRATSYPPVASRFAPLTEPADPPVKPPPIA